MVALALVGVAAQTLLAARDARAYPPPGDLVDVGGGRQLHLNVAGEEHDGPTVVLEAGMMGFSPTWAWVQQSLAEQATVVSYDRAGLGWSDPVDAAPDADLYVRDLRTALRARGLDGPYVLVGHSFGGLLIRAFAAEHPGDVAGLVFVDSSHEDQFAEASDLAESAQMGPMLAGLQAATRLGVLRVRNPIAAAYLAELPEEERAEATARQLRGDYVSAARAEAAAMPQVADHVRDGRDLGDLPVRVLTAGDNDALRAFHPDLAALSTQGRHEVVAGADHVSLVTEERHAAEVTAAVTAVLGDIDG